MTDPIAFRDKDGCAEVVNPHYSIQDDLRIQRASIGTTFFRATMKDIRSMAMGFNSITQISIFNRMRSLARMGIMWMMIILRRVLEGMILTPTYVLLARIPLV